MGIPPSGLPPRANIDDTLPRPPDAGLVQRHRRFRLFAAEDQCIRIGEEAIRVLRAALVEIGPEPPAVLVVDAIEGGQALVRPVVARQRYEPDAIGDGGRQKGFQHVAEIAGPAEGTDDDEFGMPRRALDIGIDRHRVRQRGEAGEAQGRLAAPRAMGGGDGGEFRVGGGEEEDIARRLAKVDGLLAVGDGAFLG